MTLFVNTNPRPVDVAGDRFAVGDVPPTTYTRRAVASQPGTKVTLRGLSVRALLQQNGVDPDTVSFVNIIRGDGSQVTLPQADIADPPPFPEGPALITDDGATTRFFRPVRGRYAVNARDEVYATATTGALQIYVDGGDVSVIASVNRPRVSAGKRVTFSARVRFAPPGATLSFDWDFGDGHSGNGTTATHVYDVPGDYQARVSARGTGGSTQRCATYCAGTDAVEVTVGNPQPQPTTTVPSPGSGTGDPNAPGSSTATGGGGQGGSGGGSGAGTGTGSTASTSKPKPSAAATAKKPPPPPPKKRKPFGVTISGVLINDTGATVRRLPAGEPAGAPRGQRQTAGGEADTTLEIPLVGLGALVAFSFGALRERRGVRLRVA